jgi:hypothetical protein
MLKTIDRLEKIIIRALIVLMLLAITLGTIESGRVRIVEMLSPAFLLASGSTRLAICRACGVSLRP